MSGRAHLVQRHLPTPGMGAQRRLSHQTLDPASVAGDPVFLETVPDTGPVAGQEAGSHPRQQLVVGPHPGIR